MQQILSPADVDAILLLSQQRPVLLFKHSTACGTSSAAMQQFLVFAAANRDVHPAVVRVREERHLSDALARRLGVPHQSPQAILIVRGQALWHQSHGAITARSLAAAVAVAAAVAAVRK